MSIPIDGTYSVPVSGPSPRLAMLRTLIMKTSGIARHAWASARTTVHTAGQMPRSVAATVSSVLSTQAGYTALTGAARRVTSTAWTAVTTLARGIGRAGRAAAGLLTCTIGHLSADGADTLLRTTDRVGTHITTAARHVDDWVRGFGDLTWTLLHTRLVRSTVTTTASAASGVFVIHTLTQGLIAVKIVQAAPALMTAVVWATDPWRTLALVGIAAGAAMLIALARLVHATRHDHTPRPDGDPQPPCPSAGKPPVAVVAEPAAAPVPVIDWDAVAASVRIEITNDGSVLVHGIPNSIPTEYGEVIAQIATGAALKHWRRTRTSRPCPSRDDRRLFTKAAKEAVRNHAQATRKQAA